MNKVETKELKIKPQLEVWSLYTNVNYCNFMDILDKNTFTIIQALFQSQDPNFIPETFNLEMNKVVKN